MRDATRGTDSLVNYVNQTQNPKSPQATAGQKQTTAAVQSLINSFALGFRQDCDAKAHQFAHQNRLLGANPDLQTFQTFCSEIGSTYNPPVVPTPPPAP
jgi:hypothetical protein